MLVLIGITADELFTMLRRPVLLRTSFFMLAPIPKPSESKSGQFQQIPVRFIKNSFRKMINSVLMIVLRNGSQ